MNAQIRRMTLILVNGAQIHLVKRKISYQKNGERERGWWNQTTPSPKSIKRAEIFNYLPDIRPLRFSELMIFKI